jgi:predicted RNA-binding protein YlxR (DUF448 family)
MSMPETHERRGPTRTCIGCQTLAAASTLVRLVLAPDGSVLADLGGGLPGRGAWVHASPRCLAEARRRLARSFKAEVTVAPGALEEAIGVAARRRVLGLLSAAAGAKKLAVGQSAVLEEMAKGRVSLVLIARDARAAAESREVAAFVARGCAVAWGTKRELGAATHREQTAIVGLLDHGLARELEKSVALCLLPEARRRTAGGDASTEE